MVWSLPHSVNRGQAGFSVFDQLSYSDHSLPFGDVLSADRVRERFADKDALFGDGDNDLWTTGVTLLAYNMVRWVCAQAASVHGKLARQMSFILACNTLLSQWLMPPDASIRQTLGRYNLRQIACNEVADRPGRIEPRVIKRRPKKYTLMTKPRHEYKTTSGELNNPRL